jgi:homospermidine synthase
MVSIPTFSEKWNGPIIFIGFGSIGKATLPLVIRHIEANPGQITILDPNDSNKTIADEYGVHFIHESVTEANHRELIGNIINAHNERSLIINASVNVSSKDIIALALEHGALYVDTTIDPWDGEYFDTSIAMSERSNYALRESLLELRKSYPTGSTAVSCCGANPGMVSWLVKQALINIANDTGISYEKPRSRDEWARLMQTLGVKGVHIAERDTQVANIPREEGCFMNTWSPEGCLAESIQPAELGWGTHEKALPVDGREHGYGCKAAIYIEKPAAGVHIQTWTPSDGHHHGFLITHNEAISISDYFSVYDGEEVVYRPTCHYAYRPSAVAIASLNEFIDNNYTPQKKTHVLGPNEIASGSDELGVLLYGHAKNAYWYGSRLSIEEARELAPHQNATGLQVSSAVLTGAIWAIRHPNKGLVEAEEMDFEECLELQRPYLGTVGGHYTDWNPLKSIGGEKIARDESDPWQFSNIRV